MTASVGVAPNKFLAKLASDLEKPDGFVIITEENKQQILDPLAVSKIWGIGKVTCQALEKIGIHTIKQLRRADRDRLSMVFKNQAESLLRLVNGIDGRDVETGHETKSISAEETFAINIGDIDILLEVLQSKVEKVSQRLRAKSLQARTITLKLRYGDFKTISRSSTLEQASFTTRMLWEEAKTLLLDWYNRSGQALRLLGFSASNLVPEGTEQPLLFRDPESEKQKKLDVALDEIRNKFGDHSLRRGK